ncbi:hypothetical protein EO763_23100 (plasmid) [Pectobacterium odoriferum]|uniref:34 kDa antigenic family protein n=1 Tax=Pectobacterium odoriferum TaxID=78398 RepID=UPI001374519B|nr:34 kDa antigenic family protein [Pectobacterium odoriferum]QHP82784.1 hypothetical protein EO763_23100 [Pectobacterium odoriferum]
MKLSKGERRLYAIAAVGFVLILLLTLSGQAVKNSDVAAWLSMLFNAVMAFAAVGALLTARKWLPQMTTQEGYKLAITLVNEHYICLGPENSILRDVELPVRYICHQVDRRSMGDSTATIEQLIPALEQAIRQHTARQDAMNQVRIQLGTYGLCEADAFYDRFKTLDHAYMKASDAAAEILKRLKNTQETRKLYPSTDSPLHSQQLARELYVKDMVEACGLFEVVKAQFDLMVSTHKDMFSQHPAIGELFSVKK